MELKYDVILKSVKEDLKDKCPPHLWEIYALAVYQYKWACKELMKKKSLTFTDAKGQPKLIPEVQAKGKAYNEMISIARLFNFGVEDEFEGSDDDDF